MSKVKLDAIKPWICKKITEVLGMDDDVVVEFVYNQLEGDKVWSYDLSTNRCLIITKHLNEF